MNQTLNDKLSTLLGWELDVQVSMGLMFFVVSIPDSQRGRVEGLLGRSIIGSTCLETATFLLVNYHFHHCVVK